MKKNKLKLISLLFITLLGADFALATNKALLVGVTKYPMLDNADLEGPKHDVELASQVLANRGFTSENIVLLSESITADGKPTRQAILDGLEHLARSAKQDDFIYLHFAGHGSRQPAKAADNTETDGLDEIFLPSDASEWNDYIGSVENAIRDDEIAVYLDRIRDKGADVWVVFDSCHSGTMTRGGGFGDIRYRQVDSSLLKIPVMTRGWTDVTVGEKATFSLRGKSHEEEQGNRGSLIAFSGAQSTQTAPEMLLPRGAKNRKYHGLLTYTMMDALANHRGISYSQLGQYILDQYRLMPYRNTQPLISGTDLNAAVFGEESASENVWGADVSKDKKTVTISAGQLHNYNEGSLLNLYSSALVGDDEFLGHAEIIDSSSLSSKAVVESKGAALPRKVFTVMKNPVLGFSMTVKALPSANLSGTQIADLEQSVETVTRKNPMLRGWQPGEDADLRVTVFEDKLWFLSADQSLPCEHQGLSTADLNNCKVLRSPQRLLNLTLPSAYKTKLYDSLVNPMDRGLTRIATGENILRLQKVFSGGGVSQKSPLQVTITINKLGNNSAYPIAEIPVFKDGDSVDVVIKNISNKSQDVSALYKDSRYGIYQMFPMNAGESNRLEAGRTVRFGLDFVPDPEGLEDLIILSQPASGVSRDFAFLEQEPLGVATRGRTVSNNSETLSALPLMQVLFEAAATADQDALNQFSVTTRGVNRSTPPEVGSMEIYRWEVRK